MTGIPSARRLTLLALLAALAFATGCSSGGTEVGGIDGGGVARGAITGFGSVFVNGVEYATTGAQITINGQSGAEAQLRIGQVVTVRGTLAASGMTGDARAISFDDDVTGPISSIDLAAGSFVVLGQTIHTDATTTLDASSIQPAEFASLAVADPVEVSGFHDAAGAIVASRIERHAGGGLEVTGTVSNLDSNAKQFSLNSLTVDYAAAMLPNGAPTSGACVEAKGDSTSLSGGVLHATQVEVKSCQFAVANGDHGEIEGLITALRTAADFDVGSQRVATNASTMFEGGSSATLAANVRVEIEGTFDANDVLVASTVEIKRASQLRAQGTIDSLNAGTSTFTIFGIPFTTNTETRFEDDSSQNSPPFNFSSLRVGDYVEAKGTPGQVANSVVASVVDREEIDDERELRGFAMTVSAPTLAILGVNVVTDAGTTFDDTSGAAITAAEFFAEAPGLLVDAQGSWDGANFLASKLEIVGP